MKNLKVLNDSFIMSHKIMALNFALFKNRLFKMRDSNEVSVSDKQNALIYSPSHTRYSERGNRVHFSIGQLRDRKFQFLYCRDQNFLYEVTTIFSTKLF